MTPEEMFQRAKDAYTNRQKELGIVPKAIIGQCPFDREKEPHEWELWWEIRHKQSVDVELLGYAHRNAMSDYLRQVRHFHDFSPRDRYCLRCGLSDRDYEAVLPHDRLICESAPA